MAIRNGVRATLAGLALAFATTAVSAETLTVYWNAGHSYEAYANVIKQWETDHPGWTVNWERFQWPDMRAKLIADFAVNNPPDLSAEPGGWVQEFAIKGLLKPLDEYVARDGQEMGYPDDWQEYAVTRNQYDGHYYGVQIHLTCATLLYNVDMLKEAGFDAPPANWEQFREVALATAKNGRFGFAPNPDPGYYWPWIYQAGGDYYDPATNKVTFDSPDAASAIQFVADLIHKDKAAPLPVAGADYEGPQKLFTAGRAAMIITGPWDAGPINKGNPGLKWVAAPSLTEKAQGTQAGGVSLFIAKDAKHPDEAWDLLKRFVSLDTEIAASKEAGMTMPRKSWKEDAAVQADPMLKQFSQCLPYAHDITAELRLTGKSAEVEALFKQAISDIMYNNAPAQETLSKYAEQANAVLAAR
jgi:multiple sugar transport system substrate-binding protein